MTREQLLKHWTVIEAFRNGKKVQAKGQVSKEWYDCDSPDFLLEKEYRVKPEKKEMWVNVYPDACKVRQIGYAYLTKSAADARSHVTRIACVKVVYEEGEGL